MKTYEEAKLYLQKQAVECGGVEYVDGKQLTGKNGYLYLDGVLVAKEDLEELIYSKVAVDDWYVKVEMIRE